MNQDITVSGTIFMLYSLSMDFEENKYVFVACASINIDRVAAFTKAVLRGRYCLCDSYQK